MIDAGHSVVVATAKDKLRKLLGHKMRGICFSSEEADQASEAENGIVDIVPLVGMPVPDVKSLIRSAAGAISTLSISH